MGIWTNNASEKDKLKIL